MSTDVATRPAYEVRLERFQGPMQVLLELIEQEQLPISEVSLAQVTEQYLEHLEQLDIHSPEELADFLVVAAKLLYIKSKSLLPQLNLADDEDAGTLEQQLRIYRDFYDASKVIGRMIRRRGFTYPREVSIRALDAVIFTPPTQVTTDGMHALFLEVLQSIEPLVTVSRRVLERTVTLREKIAAIKDIILREPSVSFQTLLANAKTRTEIVVTFLAILELVKQQNILVVQEQQFQDIVIQRIETP